MERHYLPLLGALLGSAASAQSNVTVYGLLDQGVGKPLGTKDIQVRDGGASRLGFRGSEDLGSGWAALFHIEHRFTPDTGGDATAVSGGPTGTGISGPTAASATNKFWFGMSTVGLKTPWGTVNLGRQYSPAFNIQNALDPWGGVTVAGLRESGPRPGSIGNVRFDDSIRYDVTVGPVGIAVAVAEPSQAGALAGPDRVYGATLTYTVGPLWLAAAYENPAKANDDLWTVGARYKIGNGDIRAAVAGGTNAANVDVRGLFLAGTYNIGAGEARLGMAQTKVGGVATTRRTSVGYHYSLSKRTKLYTDAVYDNVRVTNKTGWDVGIQHRF